MRVGAQPHRALSSPHRGPALLLRPRSRHQSPDGGPFPGDHRNRFSSVIKKRVLTNRPAPSRFLQSSGSRVPEGVPERLTRALRLELSQLRSHSSIIYANTEPFCCTPDTTIMLSDNCTLILKKTKAQSHSKKKKKKSGGGEETNSPSTQKSYKASFMRG